MNFFVRFLTARLLRKGRTTTIMKYSVQHMTAHNVAIWVISNIKPLLTQQNAKLSTTAQLTAH